MPRDSESGQHVNYVSCVFVLTDAVALDRPSRVVLNISTSSIDMRGVQIAVQTLSEGVVFDLAAAKSDAGKYRYDFGMMP